MYTMYMYSAHMSGHMYMYNVDTAKRGQEEVSSHWSDRVLNCDRL